MLKNEEFYPLICEMNIIDYRDEYYQIRISQGKLSTDIFYKPVGRFLKFNHNCSLSHVLQQNEYQLRKILHNKKPDTFRLGFKLKFIIRNNNEIIKLNDLTKLVAYDKRTIIPSVYALDYYLPDFITIFTDGSYSKMKAKSSYIVLYKNNKDLYNIHFGVNEIDNSSLIELTAVIEGLKLFKNESKIRIVTDSRYVIKGLTEWIYNWKLNDWHTAQGEKVKHIKQWSEFDELTEHKYIEFNWVKAHSFHFENNICDKYAKELLANNHSLNVQKYYLKKNID